MDVIKSLADRAGSLQQSVAASVQNFPRPFGQPQHGGDHPGHRMAAVSGNHKFKFSLHFERRSDCEALCQTGVLVATAIKRGDGGAPVPCVYRWQRRFGSHALDIPGVVGDRYCVSADDIGMEVVCLAKAQAQHLGEACGVFGPFEVDPITQMNLENWLASGQSSFPARLDGEDSAQPRDLQIRVSADSVKVVTPGWADSRGKAPYIADFPNVQLDPVERTRFSLELADDPEMTYRFTALSRTSRDTIALLTRCFHAQRFVAHSFIINNLYQNPATPGAHLTCVQVRAQDFDVKKVVARFGNQLQRTVVQVRLLEEAVGAARQRRKDLVDQLTETTTSFTEAIEHIHEQIASSEARCTGSCRATEEPRVQLFGAKDEWRRLNMEYQDTQKRIDELNIEKRQGGGVVNGSAVPNERLLTLRGECRDLRAQLDRLCGGAAARDGAGGNRHLLALGERRRSEELRRLLHDKTSLTSELEELRINSARLEQDKNDLIDKTMAAKQLLDKCQDANLDAPTASPEHMRQVAQLKATYHAAMVERNRISGKVDQMERELEAAKFQREARLDQLIEKNARLLQERDRLEQERCRVAGLYEQTVSDLGVAGGSQPAQASQRAADWDVFGKLSAEMAEQRMRLHRANAEHRLLGERLEKLASAT